MLERRYVCISGVPLNGCSIQPTGLGTSTDVSALLKRCLSSMLNLMARLQFQLLRLINRHRVTPVPFHGGLGLCQ